jgi:hypothetical protein
MKITDRIEHPSRSSVSHAMTWFKRQDAHREAFLADYLVELWRLCQLCGFDFAILVAQAANETASFTSPVWDKYGNPAGIGVTNTRNLSLVYQSGVEAARAHVVHIWVYVRGAIPPNHELAAGIALDPRYAAVFEAGFAGTVKTLADFNVNGRWALLGDPPPYGDRIVEQGNQIFPGLEQSTEGQAMPNIYGRVPHPPFIDLPVSKPDHNGSASGYIRVRPRHNVGVVNHETQGRGAGQWYRDFFSCPGGERCANALVDYFIDRQGTIFRFNDPEGTRAGWANGGGATLPGGLEGDGPAFWASFGAEGVDQKLVSIEFEKTDAENYTDAQILSGGLLNAWVHDRDRQDWESYPFVPRYGCVTSLAHFEIGTTNCGKDELDDISRLQAVARGEMKKWQTMSDGPSVALPPDVPPQPAPALPGGLTLDEARRRFGTVTRRSLDGQIWTGGFDPNGPISLAWAHRAAVEQTWPSIETWYLLDDSDRQLSIITFSNDWRLVKPAERAGFQWMDFVPAESLKAA